MERSEIPWNNTIVVDIDDTISTHVNRDYDNAVPHTEMINKLNKMYEMNYRIVYFTARGQLSCKGDLELIKKTKEPTLIKWLAKHNVKYDDLQFGKPLGLWYVDDKAIRPDEFLDLKIEELQGGSGAVVRREGSSVIKECENAFEQAEWYRKANGYVNTPCLHSIIENTLKMDFIEGKSATEIKHSWQIDKILKEVHKIKNVENLNNSKFKTYIDRVKTHLKNKAAKDLTDFQKEAIVDLLERYENEFDEKSSFCHGDLTLGNIIIEDTLSRDARAFVFDPNVPKGIWTSYLLDLSKLNQSLRFDYEHEFMGAANKYTKKIKDYFNKQIENEYSSDEHLILILEITHWVRMLKYKKESERLQITKNINELLNMVFKKIYV